MKYKVGIPLLIIAALAAFFSFKYISEDGPDTQSRKILIQNAVVGLIREGHFAPRQIDDSFSNSVFNRLVETADFEKKFFTKEDIDQLSKYRYQLDDQIRDSKFDAYELFAGIYKKRLDQVTGFYKKAIKGDFTFDTPDSIQLNNEKIDFAANDAALEDRWDKYVKYRVLAKYMELKKIQTDEKNRRDTAKVKDTTVFVVKSDADLLKSAKGKVDTNLQKYFTKLGKASEEDRFAMYINAITHAEDPHTDFFPPREKKAFDVQMSGEFYGIGAQLKLEDDKVKIASIVPGSPSWKQGELKANDEIIKVGQGAAEPEDVQGYELEDVVQKIRGEKGTEVRLTVRRIDGSIKVIPIIRGKVALEETFAKSALINTGSGKIGYIYLSEFYSNFTSSDGRRSADDIAKEVAKLKEQGVKGIILDLRYNGGGSLYDVVDMSGIFIGAGPVVQVKTSEAQPMILKSKTPSVTYDGPFIIMVNQGSASASEILAAAMQDYKRAVIVGNTTFGKGTVQKQIPIDEVINDATRLKMAINKEPELGSLKLTIQKFYRVTGGSTQLKGVTPDISIPDVYSDIEIGERKDKAALPYDEIQPASIPQPVVVEGRQLTTDGVQMSHAKWAASFDLKKLQALSAKRIAASKAFDNVRTNAARLKKLEEDNVVYLDETHFKKEQEEASALAKKIEEADKAVTQLDISNLPSDLTRLSADTAAMERNKNWIRLLKKDISLAETVNIMKDMQSK
ncbi:carboxy terminal-processing peptidase [Rurimicrobium arvi]|uniref:Carboxy terminal-processing peptidase n=1 Tax=Rurimicrobium arvi TaxID=2049916 RepID=A0ABP8MVF6_9BACT